MKETRKAEFRYNENEDSFELWTNTGDGWRFSVGYRCVAREGGDGEKNFISWTILNELEELQHLGYKIDFRRK